MLDGDVTRQEPTDSQRIVWRARGDDALVELATIERGDERAQARTIGGSGAHFEWIGEARENGLEGVVFERAQ